MSDESDEWDAGDEAREDDAPDESERREGCLTRLIPVTTPGCATLLTTIFLLTTVLTVWLVFWLDPANVPWRHAYSWWRILAVLGLCAVIPFVVHRTISIWLENASKAFPELDSAWRAGLNALANNALSIDSVPIFLITGSSGEAQEKAFMNASGLRFSVEGVPQGPAPIHWYANSEAIYLFCSDASWTSALASLREELTLESTKGAGVASEPNWYLPGNTELLQAEPGQSSATQSPAIQSSAAPQPPPTHAGIRGTVELNQFIGGAAQPTAAPATPAGPSTPAADALRGTLIFGDNFGAATAASQATPLEEPPATSSTVSGSAFSTAHRLTSNASNATPILVSHQYSSACLQELQQLGLLLRRVRQPLCPINGILALIQVDSIHSTPAELEELQKAIRGDMETIRHATQIRVPVSAIIVGLEKERGFRELVLRVGKDRALSQRFGKRFDVQAIPTKEQLTHLAMHVCGVFEDWAYALFREEQSLTRPGNTRLYELLSKVRCGWKGRLGEILSGGFGCDNSKRDEQQSLYFSGCYCSATGDTSDRQAFVKGIIDKLAEEQELIEWTAEARRSNHWQTISANLGMILTAVLALTLAVMYFWFGR